MKEIAEGKVCYWCKLCPCQCRTIYDDYPKSMIRNAAKDEPCHFCWLTECVCTQTPFAERKAKP